MRREGNEGGNKKATWCLKRSSLKTCHTYLAKFRRNISKRNNVADFSQSLFVLSHRYAYIWKEIDVQVATNSPDSLETLRVIRIDKWLAIRLYARIHPFCIELLSEFNEPPFNLACQEELRRSRWIRNYEPCNNFATRRPFPLSCVFLLIRCYRRRFARYWSRFSFIRKIKRYLWYLVCWLRFSFFKQIAASVLRSYCNDCRVSPVISQNV